MPSLRHDAACVIVQEACKTGVTVGEMVSWVFGKRRLREAIKDPDGDPEVLEFVLRVDAAVNKAWRARGIDRALGPYSEKLYAP